MGAADANHESGQKTGHEPHEVLLPNKYLPIDAKVGQRLEVFLYFDSEDRPIATTLRPYIQLGEFAVLKVSDINHIGAFLDWGLEKDLFVPFREQNKRMDIGRRYAVYLLEDKISGRLTASAKIDKFLEKDKIELEEDQEVDLLVCGHSDIGINVIINNRYKGLVYDDTVYDDVHVGERRKGYIAKVREDGKVDVSFQKRGVAAIDENAGRLLTILNENDGFIGLTDKSNVDDISITVQMSKRNFKKAVGALYKKRMIVMEEDGIRLVGEKR